MIEDMKELKEFIDYRLSEAVKQQSMQTASIAKLAGALAKAQSEIQKAHKDKENPFFHSNYADLASNWDACREPLSKNELAVIQTTDDCDDGGVIIYTLLAHSSGEWIKGKLKIKPVKNNDPQALGSAITYGRRYTLAAMVGVAPADDDGEGATGRQGSSKQTSNKSTPKQKSATSKGSDKPESELDKTKKDFLSLFKTIKESDKTFDDKEYIKKTFAVETIWNCKFKQLPKMKEEYNKLAKTVLPEASKNNGGEFEEVTKMQAKIRKAADKVKALNPMFADSWLEGLCKNEGIENGAVEEIDDLKALERVYKEVCKKGIELKEAESKD